MTNMYVCLGQR